MKKILIEKKEEKDNGWVFEVRIGEGPDATNHQVIVPKAYWEKLAGEGLSPEELVRKSFKFLLAREPKESILKEFELPVIQKYFAELGGMQGFRLEFGVLRQARSLLV